MTKKKNDVSQESSKHNGKSNMEDPVSQLKLSIERLKAGVEKMGIALNCNPNAESTASTTNQSAEVNNSSIKAEDGNDFRKDMSAEEKKQQRAAKAAEKKARAEAAIAKKKLADEGESPEDKKEQGKEMTQEEKKAQRANKAAEKQAKVQAAIEKKQSGEKAPQNVPHVVEKKENRSPTPECVQKPSIKSKTSVKSDPKEVKFDLSMKSGSEENLVASLQNAAAASVPYEDGASIAKIHPAFLSLAIRCEKGIISELDQLCEEFLAAFDEFLNSWVAQRARESGDKLNKLGVGLDADIKPQLAHLTQSGRWPLPFALGNIVRQLKKEIAKIGKDDIHTGTRNIGDLQQWLKECQENNFSYAYIAISTHLKPKLTSAKSILTYDWNPVVNHVLLNSSLENQICCIVDHEMNGNGMKHIEPLMNKGMKCQYTDLKSAGYAMQSCSIVLLGCSAVLSNGNVAAPRGSLQLALLAKDRNIPVLVVAQSFKFVDKVQYQRMALLGTESVEVVPSDLVTAIVTDIRILPPSSAPAVLKAKALEME
ncbi:unnamed protein product [Auanema sp. JU1783]|nr:unnamed protein product [Auanema sp. JU1783]